MSNWRHTIRGQPQAPAGDSLLAKEMLRYGPLASRPTATQRNLYYYHFDTTNNQLFQNRPSSLGIPTWTQLAVSASIADGDKGDITTSGSGATWTIDAAAVTLAKMADLAADTIVGRANGAGTGVPTALTATQARAILGDGTAATGSGGLARATSPTFVTPALGTPSSGALTSCTGFDVELLATATPSAAATVDFTLTGWTNSAYIGYLVVFTNIVPATDAVQLWLRTSTDGGATYDAGASDYRFARNIVTDGAVQSGSGSTGATSIIMVSTVGSSANEQVSGWVRIARPSSASFAQVQFEASNYTSVPDFRHVSGGGARVAAADVDAIQFLMSSGNIASGEFRLYGIRNA